MALNSTAVAKRPPTEIPAVALRSRVPYAAEISKLGPRTSPGYWTLVMLTQLAHLSETTCRLADPVSSTTARVVEGPPTWPVSKPSCTANSP
eukprot:COSAG04_NODE_9518_length_856_cov_0.951123_2_plen_91_part_01